MDFRLNEEQQMLQDTVERLVRGEYSFEKRLAFSETELGFSADFWQQLSELGLHLLHIAAEQSQQTKSTAGMEAAQ
jgi:alkylation response protein AidB-like acyl-CoA dehydrogenase